MVPNCLLAPSQSTVLDREFERIIIGAANVFLPLNFFYVFIGCLPSRYKQIVG